MGNYMEWIKLISDFGAIAVLVLFLLLFIKGLIVPKKTIDRITRAFEDTIKTLTENYRKKAEINGEMMKELLTLLKKKNNKD